MIVKKRNGEKQDYKPEKIKQAMAKAFKSVEKEASEAALNKLLTLVEDKFPKPCGNDALNVEEIQDFVEQALMEERQYEVMKSYILYRESRAGKREARSKILGEFPNASGLGEVLEKIQKNFPDEQYSLNHLRTKFTSICRPGLKETERFQALIKTAVEQTSIDAPAWEKIAARLLAYNYKTNVAARMEAEGINNFYEKLNFLTEQGLYGRYILENYTAEEVRELEAYMDADRDDLFTYSGLDLLLQRYVIRTKKGTPLETPQELFMGISMHLAMKEKNGRLAWAKRFYDMLSKLQVTVATPTLSNARKPYHQLSSCFIDTVPDSLEGIYRSIDNFAHVSKFGGGMGLYFGKVRGSGSAIRGFEGAAGGVIRWIRLANDTAVAVDQLGVRQGSVAVYLDAWHWDLPEFLNLRTNNGDDRMKAHDVFPGVCYPDYFWECVRDNIDGNWHLMCPHEILTVKGYALEDSFGKDWEEKYLDCVNDKRIRKRTIPLKEIVRLIIRSLAETGTPFTFNRDLVNKMNPNGHLGKIYCSNLCTEIAQNMSEMERIEQRIEEVNGETVVVNVIKPGEFVVCNLASLSLGRIEVENYDELSFIVESAVRALDNVIDLNFFPLPYAKLNNQKYRPVGLGVSGYHHMLAKRQINWESEKHLDFAEKVFADIHYAAVSASNKLALEKGKCHVFEGSDWQTGAYFEKRGLVDGRWKELRKKVSEGGLRNAYILAIAPTSSTSLIAGTTPGIDPILNRYFMEEKKSGLLPRVAPDLNKNTFWFYKNAHYMEQTWSVKACGIRSRHIDQAQSMNLYVTNDYTFRRILNLYLLAWEKGVKTIYYVRSRSLEIEECEVCSS